MGDRLGDEGAPAVRLGEREVDLGGSVVIEQTEQSTGGAAEMTAVLGDLLEERPSARAGGDDAIAAAVLARTALVVLESFQMALVFDLSPALPGALVRGDFSIPVEHAHETVGGDEHQGFAHERVRDRVVVAVEA